MPTLQFLLLENLSLAPAFELGLKQASPFQDPSEASLFCGLGYALPLRGAAPPSRGRGPKRQGPVSGQAPEGDQDRTHPRGFLQERSADSSPET